MKMMLIGLGKHEGAKIYHRAIMNYSFGQIVRSVGREVLKRCRIVAGLGDRRKRLRRDRQDHRLASARVRGPREGAAGAGQGVDAQAAVPRRILLIIDEIGKNISGTGMDTNVIGRKYNDHARGRARMAQGQTHHRPRPDRGETHGNATGLGMAEFCLTRVIEADDIHITRINCLTGGHPTAAMLPLDYPTDRDLLDHAFPTIGLVDPPDSRLLWIRNTLDVAEIECSRAYYDQARARSDLEVLIEPRPLPLDLHGNLPAFVEIGRAKAKAG
jgi:hypothetical protein